MNDVKVELKDYNIEIQLPYADRGLPGKSAYELAVEHGYSGTEEQWIASLKGEDGDVGPQGPQGPQGETGATGKSGVALQSTAPTDPEVNVWINPNAGSGDVSPTTAEVEQMISTSETNILEEVEQMIDDAIAESLGTINNQLSTLTDVSNGGE